MRSCSLLYQIQSWRTTSYRTAATVYSMYWQPTSIIKSCKFITSSCSLSPTVMQGTPFPFPGPSTVNKFLRRSAFSPNKEIFPMRPNNLTRCIFKTNVPNECRINNKANIYKHIHQKETHFKATNQQCIKRLKCACVCFQLIPRWRVGKVGRKSYWRQKIPNEFEHAFR